MVSTQAVPTSGPDIDVTCLAEALAQGRIDAAADLFRRHGARVPSLLWRPSLLDLQHPVLRAFLRGCDRPGPVPESFVDSEEFAALADWAMVVEATPDGDDHVYRHYGAGIAESYGRDMTGARISSIGGHISTFFQALYMAAGRRGQMVKSVHEPPQQVFVMAWRRLIVPLMAPDGRTRRFAVANVPDNPLRAGLDVLPDPVLIVSADGRVCCANRAACLEFARPRAFAGQATIDDWIGAKLPLPDGPDAMILKGENEASMVRVARRGRIVAYEAAVGATYYRDCGYFVVHLRREPRHGD